MALKDKRDKLIKHIKSNASYLAQNADALEIYQGGLLPYIDAILKKSLSQPYYDAIKERILPINILQRYVDKVSTAYSKPPARTSANKQEQDFVDFYSSYLDVDNSGFVADQYSNLFKSFAWEPYIDLNGNPSLREIPSSQFLVYSDSEVSPDEETVFLKFIGRQSDDPDSMLVFAYSNEEFDAFLLSGETASQYLIDNQGVNLIGTIPFVYGKRQKNRLIPILDSDMLAITKAIPVMFTDGAGAQMFQAFSILYGIDVQSQGLKMSPNAFWDIKSDKSSDKTPSVGVLSPTAQTSDIVSFIINVFVLWLETKGIRVGSIGNTDAGNAASGIAKIIDEMDTYEIRKKSMKWFEVDEEELWNIKLPKIHNYWIKSGQIKPAKFPPLMPDKELEIAVEFEKPQPMLDRATEIANTKSEVELGTMTLKQAIEKLHPEYEEAMVEETLKGRQLV